MRRFRAMLALCLFLWTTAAFAQPYQGYFDSSGNFILPGGITLPGIATFQTKKAIVQTEAQAAAAFAGGAMDVEVTNSSNISSTLHLATNQNLSCAAGVILTVTGNFDGVDMDGYGTNLTGCEIYTNFSGYSSALIRYGNSGVPMQTHQGVHGTYLSFASGYGLALTPATGSMVTGLDCDIHVLSQDSSGTAVYISTAGTSYVNANRLKITGVIPAHGLVGVNSGSGIMGNRFIIDMEPSSVTSGAVELTKAADNSISGVIWDWSTTVPTQKAIQIDSSSSFNKADIYGDSLFSSSYITDNGLGDLITVPGGTASGYSTQHVGASVASASTIGPTGQMFSLTGSVSCNLIAIPYSGWLGCLTMIPAAAAPFTTGGTQSGLDYPVGAAFTATPNVPIQACFDGTHWWLK